MVKKNQFHLIVLEHLVLFLIWKKVSIVYLSNFVKFNYSYIFSCFSKFGKHSSNHWCKYHLQFVLIDENPLKETTELIFFL